MADIDTMVREYLVKEANIGSSLLNFGKRVGQGAWNLAAGGKTVGGKWNPLAGLDEIGRAKAVYKDGPLKGMRMFDPKTGDAVLEKGRNLGQYLKQEFQGSLPSRADVFAHQQAGKAGMNKGQFLAKMQSDPAFQKQIADMNSLSPIEFMKKYPRTAARYYGGQAAYKGAMVGLPAYESYSILANGQGNHPEEGTMANLGSSIGTNLGFFGAMPLGWVGAPMAAGVMGNIGKRAGRVVDRMMGNKPLGQTPPFPTSTQLSQLPVDYVTGAYPPEWLNQQAQKWGTPYPQG